MVTTQRCMDCIQVTGIRGYGYTGFLAAERTLGQWFEVDLTLGVDLTIAGQSDRLEDTLNYAQVVELVQELLETSRFQLLERLATAIVTAVFDWDSRIEHVQVRLTKLTPPIPHFAGQVAVEMRRQRQSVSAKLE
ncbi:dihydroneopterin aldolase [Trichothermofontia sichuanensis B231]|uniref:dihydroneopterin aldolase n=1 Tax=Trichothermofontia sichuanensis TaxID=3045816 RepID=UPI00224526B1|nr:dihydroneopterin aldolase [Trichothermofontia sichuanensis]UZQ55870.1 dihydroneopterin aldolase [Trichothermofontia sichuanensis B231]